jgi:hypothetical protein
MTVRIGYTVRDWYWIVDDTNPTTQVYSSAGNAFVANNAAAYLTWLTDGDAAVPDAYGSMSRITAMADNGAGKVRLTLENAALFQTGQRFHFKGLDGTPLANGNQQIIKINSTTIDITAVSFVAGTLGSAPWMVGPTIIDTALHLADVLNIALFGTGTGGIVEAAPKTDSAAAQGDWTSLAHQSNPGQFDGRNNEVWGLGYNLSNAWASRNGVDDGATLGRIETHYMPDAVTGPALEYHYACVSKVAGGEFRALSFAIQKAGSSNPSPYYTVGSISAHEFRITRPSDAQEVFAFSPQDSLSGTLGTFRLNDGYINIANINAANPTLQVYDQRKASTNLLLLYQFNSVGKWRTQIEHTTFKWVIYDEVANAAHTTFYSNGGVNVGAPTGGDKGIGTLNATGLYINGTAVTAAGITALTGDVTATGPGSVAATIANEAVTNAKLANMASSKIKGRKTAGTGDPEDLSASDVLTILDPAAAILVEATRSTDQTVTVNTWTKIQFSTENTDTENIFDPMTNYRATPTKAGLYLVHVHVNMTCADGGYGAVAIYKNGVHYAANFTLSGAANTNGLSVTAFVQMNGSTDYIEGYGYSSDATTPKFTGGSVTPNIRIARIH